MLPTWSVFLVVPLVAAPTSGTFYAYRASQIEPLTGELRQLDARWATRIGEGTIEAGDLLALRRVGGRMRARPVEPQVVLANGDVVPGKLLSLADEVLEFQPRWAAPGRPAEPLRIPSQAVAVIWLIDVPRESDRLPTQLPSSRERDLVLLRNGDQVVGTLQAIDAGTRKLRLASESASEIELNKVAAIAFSTELARTYVPRNAAYGRLLLANGTRLALASAKIDGGQLQGTTLFRSPVAVPFDAIVALDVLQGKAVYLADLKPTKYQHTPYLGLTWPPGMNRSVAGNDLRLGGDVYDRGIGLHSQCEITYRLDGKYRRFEAVVGLDDVTGTRGDVEIAVRADGKDRDLGFRALRHADGPRPVRLDVRGVRELTLLVNFGNAGDVQDHVNWADACLIK